MASFSSSSSCTLDDKVIATSFEAALSKLGSSKLGYFQDDYLPFFVGSRQVPKKPPIINRGYFGRVECINTTLRSFVNHIGNDTAYQILNIGGGYDTIGFRVLAERNKQEVDSIGYEKSKAEVKIFEVDFPEVIRHKTQTILSKPPLREVLLPTSCTTDEERNAPSSSFKTSYGSKIGPLHSLSCDLRDADSVVSALLSASFDPSIPTLVISECVLVYISKHNVESLVKSISTITSNSLWVTYDMINPTDSFGRVMVENLKAAGHGVPGIIDYPSLESQEQRFLENGWDTAVSETFLQAFDTMISGELKKKIYKLEIFDELEEWSLLMAHYSLTVATKGDLMTNIYPKLKMPQIVVTTSDQIPISRGWSV